MFQITAQAQSVIEVCNQGSRLTLKNLWPRHISTNYMLKQGFFGSPSTKQGTFSNKTPNLGVSVWCLKSGGMIIALKITQHWLVMENV